MDPGPGIIRRLLTGIANPVERRAERDSGGMDAAALSQHVPGIHVLDTDISRCNLRISFNLREFLDWSFI